MNEPTPRPRWLATKQGLAVLLSVALAGYLVYLLEQDWVHEELRDGFTLGFFPVVGVLAMLACTAVMIFDRFRAEVPEGLAGTPWWAVLVAFGLPGAGYLLFVGMDRIGFLLVAPVFLFVYMWVMGLRPLRTAIMAAVSMTAGVYLFFRVIGIELPNGILPPI